MVGGDLPPSTRRTLAQTASALARGMNIAEAGEKNGVWLPWEARAISAAAAAGRLESLFASLSAHYAGRSKLFQRIKSRLVFPLLILLLASFVAPFPALFQGAIGPGGYLLRAIGPPVLLYCSLRLLVFAYRRQSANETGAAWARLMLAIPVFGGLLARQQRRDGLFGLLLLLEAGVPILEALPLAGQGVADPLLRGRYLAAARALTDQRSSAAEILEQYGLVGDPGAAALFVSGEAAGRLDEVIRHQLRQWDSQLELQWDTLAEWLPRLIYAAIAGFMAMGIFSGYQGLTGWADVR
jgi:general secretion pathway protein F